MDGKRRDTILETRLQLLLFFFVNKFQRAIIIINLICYLNFTCSLKVIIGRFVQYLSRKNNHLRLHSSTRAVSWPQIKSMVDGWIDLRVIDTIRNNNSCSAFFLCYSCFFFFYFPFIYIFRYNVVKIYSLSVVIVQVVFFKSSLTPISSTIHLLIIHD